MNYHDIKVERPLFISVINVFHVQDANGRYKIPSAAAASKQCESQGMRLATRRELEHARQLGYDWCECGWLVDGTVGYPIVTPRDGCGGASTPPGVRTCPVSPWNGIGWDAFCSICKQLLQLMPNFSSI